MGLIVNSVHLNRGVSGLVNEHNKPHQMSEEVNRGLFHPRALPSIAQFKYIVRVAIHFRPGSTGYGTSVGLAQGHVSTVPSQGLSST